MLILCDFDGTITMEDVTNMIWDHCIGPSWRGDLLTSYKHGHISHLKIMIDGYKQITMPEREILEYVKPRVVMRPGFDVLRQHCEVQNWPLTVLSGGLDFYIKAFLPHDVPFYSYLAHYKGYWVVDAPHDIQRDDAEDFKVCVKRLLKKKFGREKVVFIGDGRNDFPVAKLADRVFAVRGSMLARLCAEKGVAHEEFETFEEVRRKL